MAATVTASKLRQVLEEYKHDLRTMRGFESLVPAGSGESLRVVIHVNALDWNGDRRAAEGLVFKLRSDHGIHRSCGSGGGLGGGLRRYSVL